MIKEQIAPDFLNNEIFKELKEIINKELYVPEPIVYRKTDTYILKEIPRENAYELQLHDKDYTVSFNDHNNTLRVQLKRGSKKTLLLSDIVFDIKDEGFVEKRIEACRESNEIGVSVTLLPHIRGDELSIKYTTRFHRELISLNFDKNLEMWMVGNYAKHPLLNKMSEEFKKIEDRADPNLNKVLIEELLYNKDSLTKFEDLIALTQDTYLNIDLETDIKKLVVDLKKMNKDNEVNISSTIKLS